MLDDRDYMRRSPRGPENKVQTGMSCVYALIAINAVAFLVTMGSRQETVYRFWLSVDGLKDGMFWQILTAMFMHGGIGHIFFNMWGLYIFGGIVAPRLGGRGFSRSISPPDSSAICCGWRARGTDSPRCSAARAEPSWA